MWILYFSSQCKAESFTGSVCDLNRSVFFFFFLFKCLCVYRSTKRKYSSWRKSENFFIELAAMPGDKTVTHYWLICLLFINFVCSGRFVAAAVQTHPFFTFFCFCFLSVSIFNRRFMLRDRKISVLEKLAVTSYHINTVVWKIENETKKESTYIWIVGSQSSNSIPLNAN